MCSEYVNDWIYILWNYISPFICWYGRQHHHHFTNIDKIYKLLFHVFFQVGLSRYELHNKGENEYMFQIGIDSFIHAIPGLLKVRNLLFYTNLIEIMTNSSNKYLILRIRFSFCSRKTLSSISCLFFAFED